uniref:NADH dehydrogenase subunit 5 n=1 Tax=Populus trichocarpa TaxID=3694 RepID=A0A2K1Y5I9_POPTR
MEHTYQYLWIISFVTLPVPMLIGMGLLLFRCQQKNFTVYGLFPVFIVKYSYVFSIDLFIQQINSSSIYQYVCLGPSTMIFLRVRVLD